ncbi:hypothetical protein L1987_48162 [Smallanthus sonchifolius]|uniref:Uncharacterized protein n=1 Tax=Smallanthus sonchifolius TaxID=185202 RepID=A0ACB9FR89_9ASTR|nr:hypothetical protein L1987_48162 [Smallanthus sonchifolius]
MRRRREATDEAEREERGREEAWKVAFSGLLNRSFSTPPSEKGIQGNFAIVSTFRLLSSNQTIDWHRLAEIVFSRFVFLGFYFILGLQCSFARVFVEV